MSRVADFQKYLERIFDTPGGREVLGHLERQADDKDRRIVRRHECVAQAEEARRLAHEELPKLRAVCGRAQAEVEAAREALRRAEDRRERAGRDAEAVLSRSIEERRRAESGLRNTADPRLTEARSLLSEAHHHWRHAASALAQKELHGEFMEAHYVVTNRAEIDALKARVEASIDEIEMLLFVPEPSEPEIVAAVTAANAAARPSLACVRRFFE